MAWWLRRPPRERKIQGSNPACDGIFPGRVILVTSKLALQCQAPGLTGSLLGLVDPLSVYCDCVRWTVWSATSVSVWPHVKLAVQILPLDTLACCWDVKQATNQQLEADALPLGQRGGPSRGQRFLNWEAWSAGCG